MALGSDDLGRIDALLAAAAQGEDPLPDCRARFPGLSLTRCEASDMSGEAPFRAYTGFYLYLVDGTGHCWHITDDPACATGIVVAVRPAAAK
jgi:hypothetical protein